MENITIGQTDIILKDFGEGNGKIIISDYDYNFSYHWGAMGKNTTLKDFLCEVNSDYFVNKLSNLDGDFDHKGTFRNIRKHIRDEFNYELPWYKHTEFQKELRVSLNEYQNSCYDERQFVDDWDSFWKYTVDYYLIEDNNDQKEIESMFQGICEQWHFIEKSEPKGNIWLKKLHKQLKKKLKS